MREFFLLILSSFSLFSFAKPKDIDSIAYWHKNKEYDKVIKSITKKDITLNVVPFLADSYYRIGDLQKGLDMYIHGLSLAKEEPEIYVDFVIKYAHFVKEVNTLKAYNKSIGLLEDAEKMTINYPVTLVQQWHLFNVMGHTYNRLYLVYGQNTFDKAKLFHDKSLNVANALNNNKLKAKSWNSLGNMYLKVTASRKDLLKARDFYLSAKSTKFKDDIFSAKINCNLGIVHYLLEDYDIAVLSHVKALEILLDKPISGVDSLPALNFFKGKPNKGLILQVLYELLFALIKQEELSNDPKYLHNALNVIALSDSILDSLFMEVKEEQSKLFWRKRAASFYFLGMHLCYKLKDVDQAFYFSEKNKSLLLLEYSNLKSNSDSIPPKLRLRHLLLQKKVYSHINSFSDTKKDLIGFKLDLEKFEDSIKLHYPAYFNNFSSPTVITLDSVIHKMTNDQAILSYVWDKNENQFDVLYGIFITKNKREIFRINDLKQMDSLVALYKSFLTKPFYLRKKQKQFQNTSFTLYSKLIPYHLKKELNGLDVLVLPDSDIYQIPFESLNTEKDTLSYFIESNAIRYANSATFLFRDKEIGKSYQKDFIAFAPNKFEAFSLQALPESVSEIKGLSNFASAELFTNDKAIKRNFYKHARTSKVIHLATHSKVGKDNYSWIAFKDSLLHFRELYTMDIPAELVALSSCETSVGDIVSGEGVMSLSRGFFQAGTKSVLASLWNVNDKSSSEIMTSFYKNISKGYTKSEALRFAKLDYLTKHKYSDAAPFYWSSFVLIGQNDPIDLNDNTIKEYPIKTLFFIGLILVLLWYFFKVKL